MRALFSIVSLLVLSWGASLAWFMQAMPQQPLEAQRKADAIVVLTGGAERVEHGLEMLAAGSAPVLFITGVGPHVTRAQMLQAHASPQAQVNIALQQPEIVFDYQAASTQSNAEQTQNFVAHRPIHSIRLVTAHYHMPRSLLEFHRALPNVTILADPVFPEGFQRDQWWQHDNTRRLVFSEYYKYYGAMLRSGAS